MKKSTFNIYAAEAGALNLEAKMKGINVLDVLAIAEYPSGIYKRWVAYYVKKIVERELKEKDYQEKAEAAMKAAWDALTPEQQAAKKAYAAEYAQLSNSLAGLPGKKKKSKLYKIRRQLEKKYGLVA